MYCVNCGVKLADSEEKCPLCGVAAYHPQIPREPGRPLYPRNSEPATTVQPHAAQAGILLLFLLPMVLTLIIDLRFNRSVTWSGYVAGGLLLGYITLALPGWFRRPNPVIFVPCDFAAAALYLLYICLTTGGKWFLPFALPVTGGFCLIVTTVVTLTRYLRRGKLYIFGGAAIALGALMLLMEFLMVLTFSVPFLCWSVYPMVALLFFGGWLIFLAINGSARETVERKLFI